MNSDRSSRNNGRTKTRGRYRNLMLVGDQGEVIPFRRFKLMAYGLITAVIVLSIVVVVLGVLLTIQHTKIKTQHLTLKETQQQLVKMRDEKDLLLTQIVIDKKKSGSTFADRKDSKAVVAKPVETVSKEVEAPKPKKASTIKAAPLKSVAPKTPPPAPVKMSADARRIKVSYSSERQLLSLSFRIYNTSKPKVPLTGRTVVVFKNQDDPPIQWLAVPRVQLIEGKPSGKRGKAFKINNYRTESFKAFRTKAPVRFNTATIFVYSSTGELLLSKDYSFKIAAQPPPKPVIPAPKPVKEKKVVPAQPVRPDPKPAPLPTVPSPVDSPRTGASDEEGNTQNESLQITSGTIKEAPTPEPSPDITSPDNDRPILQESTPDSEQLNIDGGQTPPTPIQNQPTTQGEQR